MFELEESLDKVVEGQLSDRVVSAVLRVEDPTTCFTYEAVAGTVSRDDVTAARRGDTFRIASVTKTMTAAVIVALAYEGRCDLSRAAIDYLDDESAAILATLHRYGGRSYGEKITVRQLLEHSSGLFDYAMSPGFAEALTRDPGRRWRPQELLSGASEWGEPHFEPGGGYRYAYSDTNYVLLGLIIEALDGCRLDESYRSRILDPLGMTSTYLEGYEAHRGGALLHAYQGSHDVMTIHGSADWAGGGLVSCAEDLARFGRGLFGGVVVDPSGLEAMQFYEFRVLDPSRHSPGFVGYGLGLEARRYRQRLFRGHRGHWGVIFHVDPIDGLVISGTINQAAVRPDALFSCAVDAVEAARSSETGAVGLSSRGRCDGI